MRIITKKFVELIKSYILTTAKKFIYNEDKKFEFKNAICN